MPENCCQNWANGPQKTLFSALALVRGYRRDETGTLSIFAIFMMMAIIVLGGIGIDLMYNELKRTKLQATLDRAVLAAADLDQELDPESVVRDYFEKAGFTEYLGAVNVVEGENYRRVSATAQRTTDTFFSHLIGYDTLEAPAAGTAEEHVNLVEIGMVLDVSGSMRDNQKMKRMQNAAGEFIDTVMNEKSKDRVTISLVPYSEHVNAGPALMDLIPTTQVHGFSHCLEFPDAEFGSTALNTALTYEQAQHYQWNYYGTYQDIREPVCPMETYERILPYSEDASQLKSRIDALQPRAGTSIFLGMKWASALLDPSFRTVMAGSAVTALGGTVDGLDNFGLSDPTAATLLTAAQAKGLPRDFSGPDVVKTIVLMTDGQHDRSNRIANWAYDNPSEYVVWSRFNMWSYLVNYVPSHLWDSFYYEKYNATKGDGLLDNICDAAKARGIIVWSIGFEVQDHGAAVMENCASSPSHFFRVEGVEIYDAFSSIAQQINQLRLTQ